MSTDLVTVNEAELQALAQQMGTDAEELNSGGDFLPQLKVNYLDEDADTKKELKKGTFFITNQDVAVYGKTVVFRPLAQFFQWTQWSKADEKTVNRTIMLTSLREGREPRDEKGTVRCGKPPTKELTTDALKERYSDITLYRRLYGLVSYNGNDVDGNEHIIENALVSLNLKGANFLPFDKEFIKLMPKGSRLWDYQCALGTTRERNGATTYYVVHFEPDFTNRLTVTQDVFETIKALNDRVAETNKEIEGKYFASISSNSNAEQQDAIDAVLAADLKDDIPF